MTLRARFRGNYGYPLNPQRPIGAKAVDHQTRMSEVGCREPTVAQSLIYWCFALLDSFSGLRLGIVDLDLQHWVSCQQFRRNLLGSTLFRKVSLKVSVDNHHVAGFGRDISPLNISGLLLFDAES